MGIQFLKAAGQAANEVLNGAEKRLVAMPNTGNQLASRPWLGLATVLSGLLLAAVAVPVMGQSFPVKPVRLIIPFTPGGPNDLAGRIFAAKLTERWGQQVIVDNRGGANTIIGAELAAKAPPDGHTLFQASAGTLVNNPLLYSKLPYDAKKSFAPISMIVTYTYLIAVNPALPVNTVRELVALAKSRPGQLAYGTSGIGSAGHIAGALFETMTGVKLNHIAYKGVATAIVDITTGQIPLMFINQDVALQHVQAGKLRAHAVTSLARNPLYPDVSIIHGSGYPGFSALSIAAGGNRLRPLGSTRTRSRWTERSALLSPVSMRTAR